MYERQEQIQSRLIMAELLLPAELQQRSVLTLIQLALAEDRVLQMADSDCARRKGISLSARDGARPPVPDPAAASNPSIAVNLGSLDIELEEVAPTNVEEDRGTGVDTDPLAPPTRAEATVHNAPTRALPPAVTPTVGARLRRWARRMTIGAALIVVALGGAFYFAALTFPPGRRNRSTTCCNACTRRSARADGLVRAIGSLPRSGSGRLRLGRGSSGLQPGELSFAQLGPAAAPIVFSRGLDAHLERLNSSRDTAGLLSLSRGTSFRSAPRSSDLGTASLWNRHALELPEKRSVASVRCARPRRRSAGHGGS